MTTFWGWPGGMFFFTRNMYVIRFVEIVEHEKAVIFLKILPRIEIISL